jgi:hypothetical protein
MDSTCTVILAYVKQQADMDPDKFFHSSKKSEYDRGPNILATAPRESECAVYTVSEYALAELFS